MRCFPVFLDAACRPEFVGGRADSAGSCLRRQPAGRTHCPRFLGYRLRSQPRDPDRIRRQSTVAHQSSVTCRALCCRFGRKTLARAADFRFAGPDESLSSGRPGHRSWDNRIPLHRACPRMAPPRYASYHLPLCRLSPGIFTANGTGQRCACCHGYPHVSGGRPTKSVPGLHLRGPGILHAGADRSRDRYAGLSVDVRHRTARLDHAGDPAQSSVTIGGQSLPLLRRAAAHRSRARPGERRAAALAPRRRPGRRQRDGGRRDFERRPDLH